MSAPENLLQRLLDEVAKSSFLKHPFYEAWRAGLVPIKSLQEYATD